jgi:ABC-2 type transport system permease protein
LLDSGTNRFEQRIRVKGPALATATEIAVRTSEPPRLHVVPRLRELWAARQILSNLVRKEVKVKYKSSVLGAAWSMMNPILYLAVFTLVFKVVLRSNIPHFPVYLLSGLLAWNLLATSLSMGSRSVVDNANLVTKVYFPRELLPLASVGSTLVDFAFQGIVLTLFMLVSRSFVAGWNLLLLPLAMATLVAFTSALAMWVASLNVRYRDTQHLVAVALLAWFWVTPVVYPESKLWPILERHAVAKLVYLANPMAAIVMGFQRALYGLVTPPGTGPQGVLAPVSFGWLALLLAMVFVGCLLLLLLAWRTFFLLSGDFAEEL